MLEWAEANPELAMAILTVCVAPFIAGFARRLFPHRETRSGSPGHTSPETREAMAEMGANLRLIRQDQQAQAIDLKRLLLAIEDLKSGRD